MANKDLKSLTFPGLSDTYVIPVTGVKGSEEADYRTGNVSISKGDIGLGNVDNTSDANKPVSTATQTALDGKVPTTRTINGEPLSANITLDAGDIGFDDSETYGSDTVGSELTQLKSAITDLDDAVNDSTTGLNTKAPVIINNASGAIASFSDGADGMPVKKLVVDIVPHQSGHGDPAPDNVRAISGWTGVSGKRTGVNVYSDTVATVKDSALTSVTIEDAIVGGWPGSKVTVVGSTTSWGWRIQHKYISTYLKPSKTYYIVFLSSVSTSLIVACSNPAGQHQLSYNANTVVTSLGNGIYKHTASITTYPAEAENNTWDYNDHVITTFNTDISISAGTFLFSNLVISTAQNDSNDFIPYTGNNISVSWQSEAGTVYGGTLDVTSGKMVVTKAVYVLDGSQNFAQGNSSNNWRWKLDGPLPIVGISPGPLDDISKSEISSQFVGRGNVYSDSASDVGFLIRNNNLWIRFGADTTITTAALAKQFFTDHPTTFVYDMAIPIEYTLSANELSTLYGTNNIWFDCGDTTVEYPADTKLFIERLTAPTEDDMIANENITSGKFFMVGNNLYLSTAAILTGEQIIPGSNCTALPLADALNMINQ